MGQLLLNILKSRTVWANVISGALTLIGTLSGQLPPAWAPYIVIAVNVMNLVLRFLTTKPITDPAPDTPTPAPEPPAPQWVLWIRDILDAISRKEIPPPEGEALATKVLARELDGAKAEAVGGNQVQLRREPLAT